MNYFLFVTGCQQNIYDSEKITHHLNQMGYFESSERDADLIIALACSVRQKPVDRIFGKLKIWNKRPKKPKIIIFGCVLPSDKKKFKNKVDAILESKDIEKKIAKWLNCQMAKINMHNNNLTIKQFNNYVPIMYGCNNFCSYCAVPYTRGREVSRPESEIIEEIKILVKNGITEIMLLGQNVNSYSVQASSDTKSGSQAHRKTYSFAPIKCTSFCKELARDIHTSEFVKLLKSIEKIDELKKISFMTSHPKDMSNDLIDWMAKSKKFSHELHLPLQSGDNEILKKMNRHYTVEDYIKLVNNLKLKIKNLKLSTDIIVGFPGETKEQFERTYQVCNQLKFDKAYISQYSPRPGTLAAKIKDCVSPAEKKRRWKKLDKLIYRT